MKRSCMYRSLWTSLFILWMGSLLWPGEPGATSAEGDTRGSRLAVPARPDVDVAGNTGSAAYSIPIALPSGRGGLTPRLGLAYSSAGRSSSPFGLGWSIDLHYIERAGRRGGVPNYDAHPDDSTAGDEFVLALNGSSSRLTRRADGYYHTEQEGYLRITFHRYAGDSDNQLGGYWIVRDPVGTTYIFGYGFGGRRGVSKSAGYQCLPGPTVRGPLYSRWYLDRIVDARGNTITLEYDNEPLPPPESCTGSGIEPSLITEAAYLRHIKYSGYTSVLLNPSSPDVFIDTVAPITDLVARRVLIEYEPRPDELFSYHSGYAVRTRRRARQVSVLVGSRRIRKYQLKYEVSPEPTGASLLRSVQEMGVDDSAALAPTVFEYTTSRPESCEADACAWEDTGDRSFTLPIRRPDDPAAYLAKTVARDGKNRSYNMGVRIADLNGDGCVDLIQGWHERFQALVRRAWISDCRGGFTLDARYDPPTIFEDETGQRESRQFVLDHGFRLVDMNGDGKPDLVRGFQNQANDGHAWGGCADTETCLEAWINRTPDCAPDDSRPFCRQWQVCAPPGDTAETCRSLAWERNDAYAPPKPLTIFRMGPRRNQDVGAQFVDINGDGLPDFLMSGWSADGNSRGTWLNTGVSGGGDPGGGVWKKAADTYNLPMPLTAELAYTSLDMGVRFVDVNDDGLPDILQSLHFNGEVYNDPRVCHSPYPQGARMQKAWINTGSGWQEDPRYAFSYGFFSLIEGRAHEDDGHCTSSADHPLRTVQNGFLFTDVNGDGAVDIIARKDPYLNEVWLNSGRGWVPGDRAYKAPVSLMKDLADWVEESRGVQDMDWNADGLTDLVQFYYNERTSETQRRRWRNRSQVPNLLRKVTNPLGGVTTIEYAPTTVLPHTPSQPRVNPNPSLPIIMSVVSRILRDPILGPVSETRHEFSEGKFFGDSAKQEFRGFGKVRTVVIGDGADAPATETTTTYFLDDWNKGAVEWSGTADPSTLPARIYNVQYSQYACLAPGDSEPVRVDCRAARPPYRHVMVRQDRFVCNGRATVGDDPLAPCRRAASTFDYDHFGNVTAEKHYGLISADGSLSRPAVDAKTIARRFSAADGFSGLLLQEKVYDGIGFDEEKLLSQRRWSYDNPHPDPDCFRRYPLPTNCLDRPEDFARTVRRGLLSGIHSGGFRRAGEAEADPWRSVHHKSDRYGNVLRIIDPRGEATAGSFSSEDPRIDGYLPTSTLNAARQESQFRYDAYLRPRETTDPNGCVSVSEYDALGRLKAHWVCQGDVDVNGPSLQMAYKDSDAPGRNYIRTEVRGRYEDPALYRWKKEIVDGFGRVIQVQQEADVSNKAIVTTTRYNRKGQVAETTVPQEVDGVGPETPLVTVPASATLMSYDVLGRTVRIHAPDNTRRTVEYALTDVGQPGLEKITRTDEEERFKIFYYDVYGQLITVEEKNHGGAETYRTFYEYDRLGRLIGTTDALNHRSRFFYNSLSQKVKTIDPDTGTWLYTYDAAGNILTQTNAKNKVVTFAHDTLNRMTRKTYDCPPTEVCPPPIVYEYDSALNGKGRLAAVQDHSGMRTFAYDKKGRLTKTTYEVCRDGDPQTFTFTTEKYDPVDRLLEKTYPDGDTVQSAYNARGLLQSLRIRKGEEPWRRVADDMTYNAVGKPDFVRYGNGAETRYAYYDRVSEGLNYRLKNLLTNTSQGVVQDLTYEYDRVGHVRMVRGRLGAGSGFNVGQEFTYDDLYRLTHARWLGDAGGYDPLDFDYDAVGNLRKKDDRVYRYREAAPVHAVRTVEAGPDTWTYDYDANGNMTGVLRNGIAVQRFSYNRDDRLTVFRDVVSGTVMKYVYDDTGHRVRKIKGPDGPAPEVTLYLEGGGYVVRPDGVVQKYLSTFAREDLAPDGQRTTYYFHPDALGSTSLMTDATQSVVEQAIYKPFGEIYRNEPRVAEPAGERRKFTGHEFDAESRLYYMGARYYDPALGRFLTADRVAPNHGDPQDLNRYAYARNNPTTLTDPTGEKFSWLNFILSVAGGVLSGGLTTPVGYALEFSSTAGGGSISSVAEFGFSGVGAAVGGGAGALSSVAAQKSPIAARILNVGASAALGGMGLGSFNASGWQGALASGAAAGAHEIHPLLGAAAGFGFAHMLGNGLASSASKTGLSFDNGQLSYQLPLGSHFQFKAGLHLSSLQGSLEFGGAHSLKGKGAGFVGVSGIVDPRSGFFGPFLSARVQGDVRVANNPLLQGPTIATLSFGIEHALRSSAHLGHHLNYFGMVNLEGSNRDGTRFYHAWVNVHVVYTEALRPPDPNLFGRTIHNLSRPTKSSDSYRWVGAPLLWSHVP